ncbi:MAG: AI-2E family transporter [Micropruina sp.]
MSFADLWGRARRTRSTALALPDRLTEPQVVVLEAAPSAVDSVPQGVKTAANWAWRALLIAAALYGIFWCLRYFSGVSVPLAVAILLTALLAPLVDRLLAWKLPGVLSSVIALLGTAVLVIGVFYLVGSSVAKQAPMLVDEAMAGIPQLLTWLAGDPFRIDQAQIDGWITQLTTWVNDSRAQIASYAASIGSSIGHFFAGLAIALIATFFFLFEGRRIWGAAVSFLPERYQEPTARAGQGGWGSLVSYMRAQVLVCLVDAAGVALVAQILGLPMVLALFVITFFLSFIPVVGAFVAGSLAVLLALVTNGWVAALIMLGGTVLVMWSESHFLQPLLLGRAVSLHPLAVLLALVMGAEVAGIVGALLVIPTLAFVVSFLRSLRGESTTPSDRHE